MTRVRLYDETILTIRILQLTRTRWTKKDSVVICWLILMTHLTVCFVTEVKEFFSQTVAKNEDLSVGVVAIMTLMKVIEKYKGKWTGEVVTCFNCTTVDTTIQGLDENLKDAILTIKTSDYPVTAINSGCELFMRFITFAKLDYKVF